MKYIGVSLGENLNIYGNPLEIFGTEPWCISLGDNVDITREVLFVTHDEGTLLFRDRVPTLEVTNKIKVVNNVYIGIGSIILRGVNIGDNCIIAAGSIFSKDVKSNSVYGGVQAKRIKSIEEYFKGIEKMSLGLGHLKGKSKDDALKKCFNYP